MSESFCYGELIGVRITPTKPGELRLAAAAAMDRGFCGSSISDKDGPGNGAIREA